MKVCKHCSSIDRSIDRSIERSRERERERERERVWYELSRSLFLSICLANVIFNYKKVKITLVIHSNVILSNISHFYIHAVCIVFGLYSEIVRVLRYTWLGFSVNKMFSEINTHLDFTAQYEEYDWKQPMD